MVGKHITLLGILSFKSKSLWVTSTEQDSLFYENTYVKLAENMCIVGNYLYL